MKIAVVGPSPVPFTMGGAENLMWGLCDSINQYTEHQAELIKVPVKELSFWDLIDSYYAFYKLDLSHFDMVITSKYPSWMVQHDNSICYMMHTLRGLYDTYHLMGMPEEVERGCPQIDKILDYMKENVFSGALSAFFEMLYELKKDETVPQHYFGFPGPFIRKVVHYMDTCALKQRGVKKYSAISNTVKNRKEYFPKGAEVETIYPPTTLKQCTCGEYKYIFMISRLDGPKRIDMLIKAMKHVKSDVQLLIAGTGPERERLEQLAAGDSRIRFLGFVRDEDVENYYANSLVIPYFPYDEDYGYITIEAMLHKKPVITTVDAGGPTEFVMNGETGFVVELDEKQIAERIEYFVARPEEAKRLGENGYKLVKEITWEKVVKQLLAIPQKGAVKEGGQRKKIVVTSTFAVYPAQGGGQARIFNLYKNLAADYDVEIVAFDGVDKEFRSRQIAEGLWETVIPKSSQHETKEYELSVEVQTPVTDVAMLELAHLTPQYGECLKKAMDRADYVVLSHPYLYREVMKYHTNQRLIYEAHNVEYLMKKQMYPQNATAERLVQALYEVEKACCDVSEFIMTCSEEDKSVICELYHQKEEKISVVPNGVDVLATTYTSLAERIANKKALGLENEKLAIFMGSWHGPNLESCEIIIENAPKCPDVKFLLMGSQCLYFKDRVLPENVGLLGLVSEEEKNRIFASVDFALNPMISGSGTNLKMFDYMAAGIPIITTEFGTRGIACKENFFICDMDDMKAQIETYQNEDLADLVQRARAYAEEKFDWKAIAGDIQKRFAEI